MTYSRDIQKTRSARLPFGALRPFEEVPFVQDATTGGCCRCGNSNDHHPHSIASNETHADGSLDLPGAHRPDLGDRCSWLATNGPAQGHRAQLAPNEVGCQ